MNNQMSMLDIFGFSDEEIAHCLAQKGLLSIELEFTKKCNLHCLYCYSNAGLPAENELQNKDIKSVILQAKELGARKIVLLGGGEPLLYEGFEEIIQYISSLELQQVLFTNGILINREKAEILKKNKVAVVVKQNSHNPEIQDLLSGVPGSFQAIQLGLNHLMEIGYPEDDLPLGIQTVICRQNLEELPDLWIWARNHKIYPYFELITYQGRARENPQLDVPLAEIKSMFDNLEIIDRERFGIHWNAHRKVAAFTCKRHLYSCLVNSQGYIQPCTGVDIPIGNIKENPLKEILLESPIIQNLRNIHNTIEGPCKTCDYGSDCYGCRGNAYQMTGNYLASDPICWNGKKVFHENPADLCQ